VCVDVGQSTKFKIQWMFHCDGFSFAKTSLKICWTVDLNILNCGKANTLDPIPIMFIPSSSKKNNQTS